jgi:membrane-bound lytic murein transglycosylase A
VTRTFQLSLLLLLSLSMSACTQGPSPQSSGDKVPDILELKESRFEDLKGWTVDAQQEALSAFGQSCEKIKNLDDAKPLGSDPLLGTISDLKAVCQHLPDQDLSSPESARYFLETYFKPYALTNDGNTQGLYTGYYEPTLYGSEIKTSEYAIPLRTRPNDLVMVNLGEFRDELKGQRIAGRVVSGQLKPYEDRAGIEDGKLPRAQDIPLLWVNDAADAFFLQIQGSGVVVLPSGQTVRVGYDGQNGHPYTAIGKILIDRGELTKETVSMQAIREWMRGHPSEAKDLMRANKSYVFFRRLETDGPVGAQGVVLTAERSLAIDPVFLSYGLPVYLDIESPVQSDARIQRLVVTQDTGGAIKGPVRGDVFWGYGEQAASIAGVMKSKGQAWVLAPVRLSR